MIIIIHVYNLLRFLKFFVGKPINFSVKMSLFKIVFRTELFLMINRFSKLFCTFDNIYYV